VPVVLVAPAEAATRSVLEVLPEVRRRGAPVVLLGAGSDQPDEGVHPVRLPVAAALPGRLTPLTAVVAGQLLAWRTALLRGVDVDRPGQLSKVTLTT
jgi:glutamine---fructose-6-phosphate transaminase (isomerizing)